jgi:hypothetical protein
LRKQYFFRPSPRGLLAWDVDRLVRLSATLPRKLVPLEPIGKFDHEWRGAMVEHMRLIEQADLSFPIILSATGEIMDGRHRVAKALLLNRTEIEAVQFPIDPEADYVGRDPEDLPYE